LDKRFCTRLGVEVGSQGERSGTRVKFGAGTEGGTNKNGQKVFKRYGVNYRAGDIRRATQKKGKRRTSFRTEGRWVELKNLKARGGGLRKKYQPMDLYVINKAYLGKGDGGKTVMQKDFLEGESDEGGTSSSDRFFWALKHWGVDR